jgi:anti-sigma regulatory factor (Ser/Thr protein kinase)
MARLETIATMDNLEKMIDFVISGSKDVGFSKKEENEIHLASEEILVNIINHAYPKLSEPGEVLIRCTRLARKPGIRIEFIDSGVPFNPLNNPDPDTALPVEERPIGGLGLFIVRNVMSSVEYRRTGNQNRLAIEKIAQGEH